MSRIATVFGATGLQGGSVVRALLKDGVFKPRAITRNTNSSGAKELLALGADVVEGDTASFESAKKAVAGAEVVFAVTIPEFHGGNSEVEQGQFMIDAAKEAGVKYFVWSTITSMSAISGGKYKASHTDDKAIVDEYLLNSGIAYSLLSTGFFLENWTRPFYTDSLKLDEHDEVTSKTRWVKGSVATLSWIERDMGQSVSALFKAYANGQLAEINGQNYLMACAKLPIEEWHSIIEKTLGKKLNVTWLDTLGHAEIDDMYKSVKEFEWYADKEIPDPGLVALGVKFGTLEDCVRTEVKAKLGL